MTFAHSARLCRAGRVQPWSCRPSCCANSSWWRPATRSPSASPWPAGCSASAPVPSPAPFSAPAAPRPQPLFPGRRWPCALVAPLLLAARPLPAPASAAMPQGALLPLAKTFYLIPLLTLPFSALSGFAFPLAAKLASPAGGKGRRAPWPAPMSGNAWAPWPAAWPTRSGWWENSTRSRSSSLFALPLLLGAGLVSRPGRRQESRRGALLAAAAAAGRHLQRRHRPAANPGWSRQRWQGISGRRAGRRPRHQVPEPAAGTGRRPIQPVRQRPAGGRFSR